MLTIKKIVYNPPATIVFWNDGTKTVSKCESGDIYTKEMGFMLCVLKKKYGNKTFHDMMEKYVYSLNEEPTPDNPVVWESAPKKKKKEIPNYKREVKFIFDDGKEVELNDDEADQYVDMLSNLFDILWGE